jgi:hypothetical protein
MAVLLFVLLFCDGCPAVLAVLCFADCPTRVALPDIILRHYSNSALFKPEGMFYIESDHLNTPRAIIDPIRNAAIWRWYLTGDAFMILISDISGNA